MPRLSLASQSGGNDAALVGLLRASYSPIPVLPGGSARGEGGISARRSFHGILIPGHLAACSRSFGSSWATTAAFSLATFFDSYALIE